MRLSKARLYPQRQAEKAICYSLMELLCHDCTEQMVTNQGQEEEGRNALWGPRFCDSNVFGASESDSVNELEGFNQATMVAAPQTFLNFSNRKSQARRTRLFTQGLCRLRTVMEERILEDGLSNNLAFSGGYP